MTFEKQAKLLEDRIQEKEDVLRGIKVGYSRINAHRHRIMREGGNVKGIEAVLKRYLANAKEIKAAIDRLWFDLDTIHTYMDMDEDLQADYKLSIEEAEREMEEERKNR